MIFEEAQFGLRRRSSAAVLWRVERAAATEIEWRNAPLRRIVTDLILEFKRLGLQAQVLDVPGGAVVRSSRGEILASVERR